MKKFIVLFLIFFSLLFNSVEMPAYAINLFKEGVYKAADFNFSSNSTYSVQNISKDVVYVQLFDENQLIIQAIRLEPNSQKFNLITLKPQYRIVIVGNGEVYIS